MRNAGHHTVKSDAGAWLYLNQFITELCDNQQ